MPHTRDCEHDSLIGKGYSGHYRDMLSEWLKDEIGAGVVDGSITDLWHQLFDKDGATPGAWNDRYYEWLGFKIGPYSINNITLADRENVYWCILGGSAYTP